MPARCIDLFSWYLTRGSRRTRNAWGGEDVKYEGWGFLWAGCPWENILLETEVWMLMWWIRLRGAGALSSWSLWWPRGLFTSASGISVPLNDWMRTVRRRVERGRFEIYVPVEFLVTAAQFKSLVPDIRLYIPPCLLVGLLGLEYSYPPRVSPLSKRFPLPPPPLGSPPPPHITCPRPIFCPQYSRSVVSDYENCFETAFIFS